MPERRAFCTCGHSYWAHRVEFIGHEENDSRRLVNRCERAGCRCIDYEPVTPSAEGSEM